MSATILRHQGPFSSTTRQNRALHFVEGYMNEVTFDLSLRYSPTKWYSPTCPFFDTTNVTYQGAEVIHEWMLRLFSPFDRVSADGISFQVVDESKSDVDRHGVLYTVNAELMMKFYPRGDPEPIFAPRMFVFEIGESVSDDGCEGLQFVQVKLYWDTALVKDEMKRRALAKS